MQHNSSIFNFRLFTVRYLLPFVGIIVLLLFFIGAWFEKKIILGSEISGAYKVNRILHTNNKEEVAIIGSSRAQGGYIPDSLSKDCFNYGIDGTSMKVHLLFLQHELEKKKNKPVIINIDMEGFGISLGDISNYLYNSSDSSVKNIISKDFSFIQQVPVVKYYGFFEQYLKYYLNQRTHFTKFINKGGSFELNVVDTGFFNRNIAERITNPARFTRNATVEKAFENLVASHPERKLYLVVAPYHKSYLSSFYNKTEFKEYLQHLAKNHSNLSILDFSDMPLEDVCFFNTTHINYEGAKQFSHALKRYFEYDGVDQ